MVKWILGATVIVLMLVNCAGTFLLVREGRAARDTGTTHPASLKPPLVDNKFVGVGGLSNGAFLELAGDYNSGTLVLNHPEVYSLLRKPAFTIELNNKGVPQFHFWNGHKMQTLDFTSVNRIRPGSSPDIGAAFGSEPPPETPK